MIASAAASPPPALSPATIIRPASKPSASACPASQLSAEWQSSCGAGKGCSGASRYSTDAKGTQAAATGAGPVAIHYLNSTLITSPPSFWIDLHESDRPSG